MATSACSQASAQAGLDALLALLNGGTIKIFTGGSPAYTELPDTGTLLSGGMTIGSPAFAASAPNALPRGAIATAHAVGGDNNAAAAGTAGYWRAYGSSGACVLQGTCAKTGAVASMLLNTTTVIQGATVSVLSWTVVLPDGS